MWSALQPNQPSSDFWHWSVSPVQGAPLVTAAILLRTSFTYTPKRENTIISPRNIPHLATDLFLPCCSCFSEENCKITVIFMLTINIIIGSMVFPPLRDFSGANRPLLKHYLNLWIALQSCLICFCLYAVFISPAPTLVPVCFANGLAATAYIKVIVIWSGNFKSPKCNLKTFRFLYCIVTIASKKSSQLRKCRQQTKKPESQNQTLQLEHQMHLYVNIYPFVFCISFDFGFGFFFKATCIIVYSEF